MNHDPIGVPRPNRVPGDYLASQSGSVPWAHFGSCLEVAECVDEASTHPCVICERHRDLYGYQWPKTKKRSRYDSEERVYSGICSNGTLSGVVKGEGDREVAPSISSAANTGSFI